MASPWQESDSRTPAASTEESLRAEIAELKRQIEELRGGAHYGGPPRVAPPSRARLWGLAVLAAVLVAAGFGAGYLPREKRERLLRAEAKEQAQAVPTVNVSPVERSKAQTELVLPGGMQAISEAPVLARASGYIRRRHVDIGDRVKAGQLLAEIEAPELEQQIRQAKAALQQAQSAEEQSRATLQQARTNEQLARVTAGRWKSLAAKGAVSRQENDNYQAQYEAQRANVQAVEKAVAAARSNVAAAEANLARLTQLLSYQSVRAPFDGVITLRNVEQGTLISEGSTLLFRLAQTARLRTYVHVPQSAAASVKVGQTAALTIPDIPGRTFPGTVTRTAGALDPATRTMLTEVQVPNSDGRLLPGMYAQVELKITRQDPPLMIPGDTLVVRGDGPQVAVVDAGGLVHYQRIQVGRDTGELIEVLAGLQEGQRVVVNPGDAVREGSRVNPVVLRRKPSSGTPVSGPPAGGAPPVAGPGAALPSGGSTAAPGASPVPGTPPAAGKND